MISWKKLLKSDTIFICDFSWLMYRGLSSLPYLACKVDGKVINTGYMFHIFKVIEHINSKYGHPIIIFCLDEYPKRRKELYPDYKAGRLSNKTDEQIKLRNNMKKSVPDFIKMLAHYNNVFFAKAKNEEADDVISFVVNKIKRMTGKGNKQYKQYRTFHDVMIYTKDQDMLQLISESNNFSCVVINEMGRGNDSDIIMDASAVKKKFGILPKYIALYKAFTGDSSDNIKGYYRIRKKNVVEIINKYGDELIDKYGDDIAWISKKHINEICEHLKIDEFDTLKFNYSLTKLEFEPIKVRLFKEDKKMALKYAKKYRMSKLVYKIRLDRGINY